MGKGKGRGGRGTGRGGRTVKIPVVTIILYLSTGAFHSKYGVDASEAQCRILSEAGQGVQTVLEDICTGSDALQKWSHFISIR